MEDSEKDEPILNFLDYFDLYDCQKYHYKKIIQYALNIYNILGYGYKEHIYVNALNIDLSYHGYLYGNEVIIPILYKNIQIGFERADTIIYNPLQVIIEFKAQTAKLSNKEIIQLQKYLINYNNNEIKYGILFNFGIKFECIICSKDKFIKYSDLESN